MKFNKQTYDTLKWIAQIFLPAFATFISAVGASLEWDAWEEIVAVLIAFDTFLGVILQLSSNKYNNTFDGAVQLGDVDTDGTRTFTLSLPVTAEHVENSRELRLQVLPPE